MAYLMPCFLPKLLLEHAIQAILCLQTDVHSVDISGPTYTTMCQCWQWRAFHNILAQVDPIPAWCWQGTLPLLTLLMLLQHWQGGFKDGRKLKMALLTQRRPNGHY